MDTCGRDNLDHLRQSAADRRLLDWIRTSIIMMGLGFIVARFPLLVRQLTAADRSRPPSPGLSLWLGTGLVILAVVADVVATAQHVRILRQRRRPGMDASGPTIAVSLALVTLGLGMVFNLLVVSAPR